jgi:hypothetical protein
MDPFGLPIREGLTAVALTRLMFRDVKSGLSGPKLPSSGGLHSIYHTKSSFNITPINVISLLLAGIAQWL